MKTIRWVIAHEPIDLFLRAAEQFSAELKKTSGGQLDIEVLSLTDYANKYRGGAKVTKHDLLNLMEGGEVEMSQMYTTTLGQYSHDLFALDMPFIFESHEHASAVLDGEIGQFLLNGLAEKSAFRGLAFTYSGGFRCIPANKPLERVSDFSGLKIRTAKSPVAIETFTRLGAEVISSVELEEMNEAVGEGVINAGESTHVRVFPLAQNEHFAYINDTKHSLFLTSIIITKEFWASLSPELQDAVATAAKNAAVNERVESVETVDDVRQQLGAQLISMSPLEAEKFAEVAKSATEKFADEFSDGLVRSIRAASRLH